MTMQRREPVRVDRRRLLKKAGTLAAGVVAAPFIGRIDRAMAANSSVMTASRYAPVAWRHRIDRSRRPTAWLR